MDTHVSTAAVEPVQLLVEPVQLLVEPVQLLVDYFVEKWSERSNHILKVVGAVQPLLKYWFRLEVDTVQLLVEPVQLLVDTVQLLVEPVLPAQGQCFCLV